MDALKLARVGFVLAGLLLGLPLLAWAQGDGQLTLLTPVEGQVEAGAAQAWRFNAGEGEMLSILVESQSASFDPVVSILNSTGQQLIHNDDAAYPASTDAILEGITIPRRDVYTVMVSGYGDAAGAYRLTVLPGYGELATRDLFDTATGWQPLSELLQLGVGEGALRLSIAGVNETGIAVNPAYRVSGDFYAQIRVAEVSGRSGWQVGLVFNLQDASTYDLLALNHQGFWRVLHQSADGARVIRDWSTHPAITPGEAGFSLGLLARGRLVDVFYNDQFVGQAVDSEDTSTSGQPMQTGVLLGAANAVGSEASARIDEFVLTQPLEIDGEVITPRQLVLGSATTSVQELERRRLIPSGGRMALTVPESSVTSVRPGVTRILLARGQTYANFAFGTQVSWQINGQGAAGCGLIFRNVDDTHFSVAYLDQTGGYGLSRRADDQFAPGIFGQTALQGGRYHLLVVADGDLLRYFVNGQYGGQAEYDSVEGEVGIAVVNFEPLDTRCNFSDTWLWRWD